MVEPKRRRALLIGCGTALVVLAALGVFAYLKVRAKARQTGCASHLRDLSIPIAEHAQDDKRRAFPFDPADPSGRKALLALGVEPGLLRCPWSEDDVAYEAFTSPLTLTSPGNLPLAWDARPHPDGRRNVLFVDLHIEAVEEGAFQELLARLREAR